jgi:hypothetical protein
MGRNKGCIQFDPQLFGVLSFLYFVPQYGLRCLVPRHDNTSQTKTAV